MPVRRQAVNPALFYIDRKRSQSLNRVQKEETAPAPANLANRFNIRPQPSQVLHKTYRQQLRSPAGFVDLVERIGDGKPLNSNSPRLEPQPGPDVGGKLLLE